MLMEDNEGSFLERVFKPGGATGQWEVFGSGVGLWY